MKRPGLEHVRELIDYAKTIGVAGFTTKWYNNIDILIITAFLGSSATGIYGIGFRFSLILTMVSGAIGTSSFPELSRHVAAGDISRVHEILEDAVIFSTFLAFPAFAGMAVIAEPLIVTFYTEAFADAALIAVVAIGIQIPDGVRSVFNKTVQAIDRPGFSLRAGLILIVTNTAVDLALVPTIGPIGAVLGSFAGITLATFYLGWRLLSELDLTLSVLPFRQLAEEGIAATVMAGIVFLARQELHLPVLPELIVLISLGIVLYFGLILAISPSIRRRLDGIGRDVIPFGL
jgi:O-antigen/teichoic acid export membrane protein